MNEPSYPDDQPVGPTQGKAAEKKAVPSAAASRSEEEAEPGWSRTQLMTGAAIGIGSAALVAALLYATRARKPAEQRKAAPPVEAED